MNEPSLSSVSREDRVAEVLEAYLAAQERGAAPEVDELLARYPDLADELRECLSSLAFIRRAGNLSVAADAPAEGEATEGVLGDFRIVCEVGRGGMGVVYEAEQISLRRRVALKVLPFAATLDARHLRRFQNEAQAAACLHHTNIVPVFSVGCERGVHFYAMQFIDGQPLSEIILQLRRAEKPALSADRKPTASYESLEEMGTARPTLQATNDATPLTTEGRRNPSYFRKVAELGIQAAEALDHAHQLGIVHRDIKPANLLLDARGNVWITDFGLAHIQHSEASLTLTGQAVGTPRYMSPEQALAKRVPIDHRTDVYSLGVTLYELLTLRPAFGSEDRQELLRQIALEEPAKPRRLERAIPAELETIVMKAMEKRPQDRYTTAKELADDLERWLKHEPIVARRPSLLQRLAKWRRRHKQATTASALVLLMALMMAGYIAWMRHDRVVRRAMSEKVILEALEDSGSWQKQRRLPEALSAAHRAMAILDGGEAESDVRGEVESRMADLELIAQLENVRLEMTAFTRNGFDFALGDRRYGEIFRVGGLDMDALSPAEAGERIRARTVAVELAAALDDWATVRQGLQPRNHESYRHLLQAARTADRDSWRVRLREALENNESKTLLDLASADESIQLLPLTMSALVATLRKAGAVEQAENLLRKAQRQHPDDFWTNFNLAELLLRSHSDRRMEAISFLRAAVALRPQNSWARDELGCALGVGGDVDAAIAECREAIRLNKDFAKAHTNLGAALEHKGDLVGALAEYRESVRLNPDNVVAHINLGAVLGRKGEVEGALAECREAIRLNKDNAEAHNALATVLQQKGDLDGAIAEYHEAIRLNKDSAAAHSNLGHVLREKGRFHDALCYYRRGQELEKDPSWHARSTQWVKECERLVKLDSKLPAILSGQKQPADNAERLALAQLCQLPCKKQTLTAMRFYSAAFAEEPKLADDPNAQHRYNAACAASLAGCGQGKDADKLNTKERARLRQQALDWLRADLNAYRQVMEKSGGKAGPMIAERMQRWLQDEDFAGVRGDNALAKLPEEERSAWRKLWADVAEMLAKAQGKVTAEKKPEVK